MADLNKRLGGQELSISLTDDVKQLVIDEGYDPAFGARPLKRYLQKNIETLAARLILGGNVHEGSKIIVDAKDGKLDAYVQGPVETVPSNG
jgi:ATP-dependent Clp protease ATP-binding subunit ClpB